MKKSEEAMLAIEQFIKENNLFEKGDKVCVGCSGGSDSVMLLHFLAVNKKKLGIEVVAVYVDHCIRENSKEDGDFVKNLASELGVKFYNFKIDVPLLAKERGISLETAGRDSRYGVFKALKEKKVVNKVALAHHKNDQAETILMHIFRGSGLAGAKGMDTISDNFYVRPLLDTSKNEILSYLKDNNLNHIEDYTNGDNSFNRNYVRNVILPEISKRWPNAVDAIVNFGKAVKEDDEYINSQIFEEGLIEEDKLIKIPVSYFLYSSSIINRLLFNSFKKIGITKDIERKHIASIKELALKGENGKKINLPFEAVAIKEYDYLTILNKHEEEIKFDEKLKCGEIIVPNYGKIVVKKANYSEISKKSLYIDAKKVPKQAKWRFRQEGDLFVKFGGGRKKLKDYFIDKKIASRQRKYIPLLAVDNEILVVGGIEISDKVKIDDNTTTIYKIEAIKK